MNLIQSIHDKAIKNPKKIVLPEGTEERTLKAADIILQKGIAQLILIGNKEEILALSQKHNLQHINKAEIIDPLTHPNKEKYIQLLLEIRKSKGLERAEAEKLVENPLYLSTLIIKNGDADGEVAGADNATGNVLKPAFQIIKTLPGINVVSGAFIMIMKDEKWGDDGIMIFADCAVHPEPTAEELAQIAVCSGHTALSIAGIEPRIAMLSFSTKGSAKHERVDKVVKATALAKEMEPSFMIDGEIQADAAIIEAIGKKKAPDSPVAGKANILVFPNLETGNIAYKLVERLAGASAVGPVLQGMAAPINDLSRGCSVDDIVNLVAITVNQASAKQ